jgi:hypothetical protein
VIKEIGNKTDISKSHVASNKNKTEKCETYIEKFSDGTILCRILEELCKITVLERLMCKEK